MLRKIFKRSPPNMIVLTWFIPLVNKKEIIFYLRMKNYIKHNAISPYMYGKTFLNTVCVIECKKVVNEMEIEPELLELEVQF